MANFRDIKGPPSEPKQLKVKKERAKRVSKAVAKKPEAGNNLQPVEAPTNARPPAVAQPETNAAPPAAQGESSKGNEKKEQESPGPQVSPRTPKRPGGDVCSVPHCRRVPTMKYERHPICDGCWIDYCLGGGVDLKKLFGIVT